MPLKVNGLSPAFRLLVDQLIVACAGRRIRMVPSAAVRTPWEQAKLWRQSRSIVEIRAAIDMLKASGATFLADALDSVGPQSGNEVTRVLPGNSWHQWGEAVDCFWEVDGKAVWSTSIEVDGKNGYVVYAEEAVRLGLTAGLNWPNFKDAPHVQFRSADNPLSSGLSWTQIDAAMKERFGSAFMGGVYGFLPETATAAADAIQLSYVSPQGWRVFETTDVPAAVFRAKMSVDADGSPRAYHPNPALGLDNIVNAGRPGNWWALVTDGNGEPIIQTPTDPAPGFFVSMTSLGNPGTDPNKPGHYIDAETIPYFVLPGGVYSSFVKAKLIRLGDVGVAYNVRTGRMSYGLFADTGGAREIGEGSMALAAAVGLNSNPRNGGTATPEVLYVIFPQSGKGRGLSLAEIAATATPLFEAWGGRARIAGYAAL